MSDEDFFKDSCFLQDLIYEINENAKASKKEVQNERSEYNQGYNFAYNEVLSLIIQQSKSFDYTPKIDLDKEDSYLG